MVSDQRLFEDRNGVVRKRKTHCKHGHRFDGTEKWHTNWKGYKCRVCRECAKLRMRRKRENPDFLKNQAAKSQRWRRSHPVEYKAAYTAVHARKKKILDDARVDGCVNCGEKDLACLDFHHRNGKEDKLGHLGIIRRFSDDRIRAELAKCDVLCANCYRKYHRDEREAA